MSKTSAAVKNKYKAKAYDRMEIIVPKGEKAEIQAHAERRGESLNGFVNRAISTTMATDNEAIRLGLEEERITECESRIPNRPQRP